MLRDIIGLFIYQVINNPSYFVLWGPFVLAAISMAVDLHKIVKTLTRR